jgi:hypothetical protein
MLKVCPSSSTTSLISGVRNGRCCADNSWWKACKESSSAGAAIEPDLVDEAVPDVVDGAFHAAADELDLVGATFSEELDLGFVHF